MPCQHWTGQHRPCFRWRGLDFAEVQGAVCVGVEQSVIDDGLRLKIYNNNGAL